MPTHWFLFTVPKHERMLSLLYREDDPMTLFEAVTSGKSVKVTFKGGSEPLSGKIRAMVAANDTDECRAFAFMDKFVEKN